MKRNIMKIAAVSMAAMMCLSACKGAENPENIANVDEGATAEIIDNTANTEASSEVNTDNGFPITVVSHPISAGNVEKVLCTGKYPEIVLSDNYKEKYPKLADYLNKFNENHKTGMPDTIAEYALWASQDEFNESAEYCSEASAEVIRIDDRLFSMLIYSYEYTGGAHPNHYCGSINVDPVTGQELRLDQVLNDSSQLSDGIKAELEKNYQGVMEEVDSFYYPSDGDDPDQFVQKLKDDTYTWSINDKGLNIIFSPYEIASYATGELSITLSPTDYPNLIQQAYIMNEAQDMGKLVTTLEAENIEVAPHEEASVADIVTIPNPTWKSYKKDGLTAGNDHISLTKTKEDKTDWLNTEVWAEKHGFTLEYLAHEDENYYYSGENDIGDYLYMFQWLQIYDKDMTNMLYNFDLGDLCNGPDNEEQRTSATTQYIRYATIVDNTLYVEIGHQGYASEEAWSSYIVAIDLETNELLFRTEPLVANADNFVIVGDTIICGYGFTDEPDYIYLIDRFTGEKYETIPVITAASQFVVVGDTLYVATYNTDYEFDIKH